MSRDHRTALTVFVSYAHEDEDLRQKLETHLSNLKRQNLISVWHDRKIGAGAEWAEQIDDHLEAADIILLLVSPDFMASDYCWDVEVKRALDRHEAGEALVIPVILRSVDWNMTPFSKLQALPKGAIPITKWTDQDEAFLDVVKSLRRLIEDETIDESDEYAILKNLADGMFGSVPPQARRSGAPRVAPTPSISATGSGALTIWRRKLEFFLEQEAITADPETKFALQEHIREAQQKIRELSGS